ncbi:MAG: GNAT family N-acetyltransferase [Bacteroidetes bacterium]|nr:GNAT family N-acetyltransferase [Bacteroidota bacterium]
MITLETPRLLLRQFHIDDAEDMFDLNNDPDVIRYTGDKAFANITEATTLLRNYDQYEKYKSGRLTVILKDTQEIMGWCGLKYHPIENETDIGYRFKKKFWNKGYATESAMASLHYGFETLQLPSIVGHAMTDNKASIRVFEKLGMNFEKEDICMEQPSVFYRITKAQWHQKNRIYHDNQRNSQTA